MKFKVDSKMIHTASICYLGINLSVQVSQENPPLEEVLELCSSSVVSVRVMGDCTYQISLNEETTVNASPGIDGTWGGDSKVQFKFHSLPDQDILLIKALEGSRTVFNDEPDLIDDILRIMENMFMNILKKSDVVDKMNSTFNP
jgi:hypothetical protein